MRYVVLLNKLSQATSARESAVLKVSFPGTNGFRHEPQASQDAWTLVAVMDRASQDAAPHFGVTSQAGRSEVSRIPAEAGAVTDLASQDAALLCGIASLPGQSEVPGIPGEADVVVSSSQDAWTLGAVVYLG